ncbi:RICIN domain-containing protein [Rhodococcus marinonascens]|uniref:RICIN domain-containing protein n=1 Tax=Rhodococcus marinonascens TaxID=38311 RepID=UPI001114F685|nr:ricin-type beta-trefoil lectin domain protein [Rhodococcus marinonascens]
MPTATAASRLVSPLATSRQNCRSTSGRSDGAPGDFIGDLPVGSFIHPAGLPINTSTIEVLRQPVEPAQYRSCCLVLESPIVHIRRIKKAMREGAMNDPFAVTFQKFPGSRCILNHSSWQGHRTGAARFFGAVAVAATLTVTGASIAGAAPSVAPSTTEEAAESAPASELPATSVAPSTTEEAAESAPASELPTTSVVPTETPEDQAEKSSSALEALAALTNTVRSNATGACLDDSSFGLRALPCNGLTYQRWNLIQFDHIAQFEIQSLSTGRCLDDSTFGLRTVDCNNQSYQRWAIFSKTGGVEISNRATLKCLDDSGLGLRAIACNDGQFQKWGITPS